MPAQAYCHSSLRPGHFSETFAILILSKFLIMFTILMISYTLITIKVYKSFSKVNSRNYSSSSSFKSEKPYTVYQKRIIIKLMILILMYMISLFPELANIFYVVVTHKAMTPAYDSLSGVTLSFSILVNSIFVLVYQIETRKILLSMLPRWIYKSKYNSKPSVL
ncbi:hypothetical protein CONCODRAFT_9298 [Conidiobolus coronatus NRRL 28638]|uniref:G-protein coupled receptors family 1 profile domain-containing protein n=1 Tax=Conidiobolus coronatus (strain ATCC 28846 / CBS 209.66 / NRRL 28638) TaxID=796925 RepID=A0A137P0N9_CONC2|nr:hypothetical protein CONCODRAFT_9298 [Conidiobolus coronatus NRRL 28638]|eukprot:KXN68451.1 hypothetical protein CONCODRAFT_9298 [Conidiobolus coronatus NRRL 28638]